MKKHYYAFSFIHATQFNTQRGWVGCSVKGKHVTQSDIMEAKERARMPSDCVLVSFSYMGYMTHEEASS